MLDLAHNPMAGQRAEYGRETRYSQLEVVADVFFGSMAQVSNVLAPSTKCYALFPLVMCDKKGANHAVITLAIPLARMATEGIVPGVCRTQDAVGSSQVIENQVPLGGVFDRNDSREWWHKYCCLQQRCFSTQLSLYDGKVVTVGLVVGWYYQLAAGPSLSQAFLWLTPGIAFEE